VLTIDSDTVRIPVLTSAAVPLN